MCTPSLSRCTLIKSFSLHMYTLMMYPHHVDAFTLEMSHDVKPVIFGVRRPSALLQCGVTHQCFRTPHHRGNHWSASCLASWCLSKASLMSALTTMPFAEAVSLKALISFFAYLFSFLILVLFLFFSVLVLVCFVHSDFCCSISFRRSSKTFCAGSTCMHKNTPNVVMTVM